MAHLMHAYKHGGLERRDGKPVENAKQVNAMALHEAGATRRATAR